MPNDSGLFLWLSPYHHAALRALQEVDTAFTPRLLLEKAIDLAVKKYDVKVTAVSPDTHVK